MILGQSFGPISWQRCLYSRRESTEASCPSLRFAQQRSWRHQEPEFSTVFIENKCQTCDERPLPRIWTAHNRTVRTTLKQSCTGAVPKQVSVRVANSLFRNILAITPCESRFCEEASLYPRSNFQRIKILHDQGKKKVFNLPAHSCKLFRPRVLRARQIALFIISLPLQAAKGLPWH